MHTSALRIPAGAWRFTQETYKVRNKVQEYGAGLLIARQMTVGVFQPNPENAASSAKRRDETHDAFIVPREYSTLTNCAWTAIAIARRPDEFLQDYVKAVEHALKTGAPVSLSRWSEMGHDVKNKLQRAGVSK